MRFVRIYQPALRHVRRAAPVAVLLAIFLGTYRVVFWVRFDGQLTGAQWSLFGATLPWLIGIKLIVFGKYRIYQAWGRYATFPDLIALIKASTASALAMLMVDYLVLSRHVIPRSIFLMDWCATIVGVGGLRAVLRMVHDRGIHNLWPSDGTATLIVGANDSGESLLRAIHRNRNPGNTVRYRVVGFLDVHGHMVGARIADVPVLGTLDRLRHIVARHGVREVLISAGSLSGRLVRSIVEDGRGQGFRVRVLPSYEQLLDERVSVQPRPVAIDDLLRRDPVRHDMTNLRQWISNRTVLVTGSAGSIGSEICRQVLSLSPSRLVMVDRSECGQFFLERELQRVAPHVELHTCLGDISDILRIDRIFRMYRPHIVFHAAAYKHVPLMETNPGEAAKNIALATRILADIAHQHRTQSFVMISTDKAVKPSSVMGTCKHIAEQYVQALARKSDCRFVTVRFGNVLDSDGSVIRVFREQIVRGGPITVTHPEMTRYFMTIPEAAQLVLQAAAMGQCGEIFVLDMGEPVRIVDLAKDMIRLSGMVEGEDIEIEYIGMRPGEKLHEELHAADELRVQTEHPKIVVAQRAPVDFGKALDAMEGLERICNMPREVILAELQQTIRNLERPHQRGSTARPVAA